MVPFKCIFGATLLVATITMSTSMGMPPEQAPAKQDIHLMDNPNVPDKVKDFLRIPNRGHECKQAVKQYVDEGGDRFFNEDDGEDEQTCWLHDFAVRYAEAENDDEDTDDQSFDDGSHKLFLAIEAKNATRVQTFFNQIKSIMGNNPNAMKSILLSQAKLGLTLLCAACKEPNNQEVIDIILREASAAQCLEEVLFDGNPFMWAIDVGAEQNVEQLLTWTKTIDMRNKNNDCTARIISKARKNGYDLITTPLALAVFRKDTEIMQILLSEATNIDMATHDDNMTLTKRLLIPSDNPALDDIAHIAWGNDDTKQWRRPYLEHTGVFPLEILCRRSFDDDRNYEEILSLLFDTVFTIEQTTKDIHHKFTKSLLMRGMPLRSAACCATNGSAEELFNYARGYLFREDFEGQLASVDKFLQCMNFTAPKEDIAIFVEQQTNNVVKKQQINVNEVSRNQFKTKFDDKKLTAKEQSAVRAERAAAWDKAKYTQEHAHLHTQLACHWENYKQAKNAALEAMPKRIAQIKHEISKLKAKMSTVAIQSLSLDAGQ